jgi:hypothetical protein
MSESLRFVVSATGPTGVFWLGKPSEVGLRTLVARDQADVFPTLEDAQSVIKTMPAGFKLASISFAIELAGEVPAARTRRSAQLVRRKADEPKTTIGHPQNLQSDEPETISGTECRTVSDIPTGKRKALRKWFSWTALAELWRR